MVYTICSTILRILYVFLFRLKAVGKEHVPEQGGVLLCSNHISNLDPPTVGILLNRKVRFMAKEELFKVPVLGPLIRQLGAYPVKRGGVSKESIKTSLLILREGGVLGIFPEGSRNAGDAAAKNGAASFALRTDAAVVPVAIVGQYKLFGRTKVVYGPPINLDDYRGKGAIGTVDEATDKIMLAIRQLIQENQ